MKRLKIGKGCLRHRLILLPAIAITLALLLIAMDSRMAVRYYEVDAETVTEPVSVALVTDLHSCDYGEGQNELIEALDEQAPDLILLGGDIFDDEMDDRNTEVFLAGIAGRYPCFYVTGNHEYWSGAQDFAKKMAILERYGITILSDTCEMITINGETLALCGVNDPDSYMVGAAAEKDAQGGFEQRLDEVRGQAGEEHFVILLSHRPEWFESYAARGFDLVLCGHAHGGQWRVPWLLNGLYAPNQGLFPPYAGGRYEKDSTTMIVSRGLARESTRVPRIFNRPELVVITIR